jgi:hypothetical protein
MNSSGVSALICANLTRNAAVFLLGVPSCDRCLGFIPGGHLFFPYFPILILF